MADQYNLEPYEVKQVFPEGVHARRLWRELKAALPATLEPIEYSVQDSRAVDAVFHAGMLEIHVAREPTVDEMATIADVLRDHAPTVLRDVLEMADLRASEVVGVSLWVDDAPRASTGTGCRCYYDDRDATWRRVSDDGIVRQL